MSRTARPTPQAGPAPVVCHGCGQFSPLAFGLLVVVFLAEFVLLPLWRALS
ncbi:MAG: hypothetical protein Q8L86_04845 [Vicinamibacterales bacterium]|nr:hypothetical protein [Vicinamibacterales bacterium]